MESDNYLIEYGKECALVGRVENGFKVKIYGTNEVTEKIVPYEPVKNSYKFDGMLVERDGKYSRLKKYTTYLIDDRLVYSYSKHDINRFSDDLVYEYEIGDKYKIVEKSPFISSENIKRLIEERNAKKALPQKKIDEYKKNIETLEKEIKNIEKYFDIEGKCEHDWIPNGEEEYENGGGTKKFYYCANCGKEDTHYWTKIF